MELAGCNYNRGAGPRTSLDVTRGIDDTSSGTSSPYIDTNIVIDVRVQIVMRTIFA